MTWSMMRRFAFFAGNCLHQVKSRAFVNDSPVPLSVVKELGSRLIDIHSQHQNLLLGDNRFQLKVIDVMAEKRYPVDSLPKGIQPIPVSEKRN